MAKFKRLDVLNQMQKTGLVPLFYHPDVETSVKVMEACYRGGIRILEFTNRGDRANEVFLEMLKFADKELPGFILGVGSVVDAPTTSLYIQMGANFIVSPVLNPDMAKICNRRKVAWMPGCATSSEISLAEELGVEVVKIYPANLLGGPDFIKNVKAPCPWSNLMPSGGVSPTEENLKSWFEAGAFCVGMGSKLITKDILKSGDYAKLEEDIKNVLAIINRIRK